MVMRKYERLFIFTLLVFIFTWWNFIFLRLEFGSEDVTFLDRLRKELAPRFQKLSTKKIVEDIINKPTDKTKKEPAAVTPRKEPVVISTRTKTQPSTVKKLTEPVTVSQNLKTQTPKPSQTTKVILLWNDYDYLYSKDREPIFKGCPVSRCRIVTTRSRLKDADAVVYTASTMNFSHMCEGPVPECILPLSKPAHQVWVFHTLEPPCMMGVKGNRNKDFLLNNINWTFTHRQDSDIFTPNGEILKRSISLRRNYYDIVKKKNQMKGKKPVVGWLVSHCDTSSHREVYVKELAKYIDVEILGKCGKDCPYGCYKYINDTFKFYLSFENSLAEDYITEKFFRYLNYDVVLVTRGGADYESLGIDPRWHINTEDFPSPKALAEYLHILNNNDSLYVPYLEWKNHYMTTRTTDRPYVKWCDFCAKLHESPAKTKVYTKQKLFEWYFPPGKDRFKGCKIPQDLRFEKLAKPKTIQGV